MPSRRLSSKLLICAAEASKIKLPFQKFSCHRTFLMGLRKIRFKNEFPIRPASQIPPRIKALGRTHQGASLCLHTPETGSSPLPSCLLLLTRLLPRCLVRPHQEQGRAPLGQDSDIHKCPVSGARAGVAGGGRSWPCRPSPSCLPFFPGTQPLSSQGVLTGRWAGAVYLLGGQLRSEAPAQLETTVGGEGGGEQRKAEEQRPPWALGVESGWPNARCWSPASLSW